MQTEVCVCVMVCVFVCVTERERKREREREKEGGRERDDADDWLYESLLRVFIPMLEIHCL